MYKLHVGVVGLVLASLLIAPFAFADDDDDRGRGNSGKGKKEERGALVMPISAVASTPEGLLEQIKTLQAMINDLKAQRRALDDDSDDDDGDDDSSSSSSAERKELKQEIKQAKKELKFLRSLSRGMSGSDVTELQEWLAQFPDIYPEGLVTGFFGSLTEDAIKRFQKKHGIEQVGIFGPLTRAKFSDIFNAGFLAGVASQNGNGTGKVDICHKPTGTTPTTINVSIAALGAHLVHGDYIGTCDGGTNPTDTTAPVISALAVSNLTTTGATVTWTTNEAASSLVNYGTTTSYGANAANASLVTSHSIVLSGLLSGTMYHVMVASTDAAGNTATSSDVTFTTGTPDTTDPVISGAAVSAIGSTTATLSWTTNENATGEVYYGTTTPLNLGTALTVENATLSTAHSFVLNALSASTTYYYVLESKDASNNSTSTPEASFTTTN